MTWIVVKAWMGSKPLQYALAALVALGSYQTWKYHQRSIGAERVTEKIEAKAETNAKQAETVREDVAAGKRGRPDPNRLH